MIRVHLKGDYGEESLAALSEMTGGEFSFSSGESALSGGCRVLVAGVVTPEEISGYGNLEHVVVPYAGIPETTSRSVAEHPEIQLHSIHHNAVAASEMAVSLMLAAAKLIVPAHIALSRGDWSPRYESRQLIIEDSRILVLGWGAIGSRIGSICRAMGASVKGVKKGREEGFFTPADIPELLPETDILMISVPLNDSTSGIVGRRELLLMPAGSVLVNVSRGGVVEEEALFESLSSGHLGAAGLDVWYNYPESEERRRNTRPSRFDFGSLPNVVMSPHRGGAFGIPGIERRRLLHLSRLLRSLYLSDDSV